MATFVQMNGNDSTSQSECETSSLEGETSLHGHASPSQETSTTQTK